MVAQLNQDKFKAAWWIKGGRIYLRLNPILKKPRSACRRSALRALERNRELKKRDIMAQSELDAAQTAYDPGSTRWTFSKAQIAQAQAALNQTSVDLNNTVIHSPVDGIVISRSVDVGQTVCRLTSGADLVSSLLTTSPKWRLHTMSMKPTLAM